MYPEEAGPEPAQGAPAGKPTEGETALIPKSLLGGKKFSVGDEVVLKIVHEYEDEVEVAYATETKAEEAEEPEPANMGEAQDRLGMMAG